MNTKSKLTLSLGLLLAPLALMAKSPEKAYVESYRGRTDIPTPISVVSPVVEFRHAGQQVVLEFVVDPKGKPVLISAVTPGVDAAHATASAPGNTPSSAAIAASPSAATRCAGSA